MARKEINVFGTSFLDLLSGALAAVIILFVIVPKMSSADQEALREIEEADMQVTELAEMLQQLENSVPQEQYDAIMQQIESLQNTIQELREHVNTMQQELQQVRRENEQLRQQIAQLQQQQQQMEEQQQRIAALEEEIDRQRQASQMARYFGINADLGVVCTWRENFDVDLHVTDLRTMKECDFRTTQTAFGQLNEDVTSREVNDDRYELFFQRKLVPGTYKIEVCLYDSNGPANVEGFVILHPGKSNEVKIPYRNLRLTSTTRVTVGILTVTNNNINLQQ